jgi:putative sigma-54 modulation protein
MGCRGMTKTKTDKKTNATARVVRKAKIPPIVMTVTFRHVAPSAAIRTYAERKFAHLAKFLKRPCEAHLILTIDKYRHHGEVTIKSGQLTVTAQEETKDLYSVIDLLADKVGRQVKSQLGKAEGKKIRAVSTGEVLSAAEESMPNSDSNRV